MTTEIHLLCNTEDGDPTGRAKVIQFYVGGKCALSLEAMDEVEGICSCYTGGLFVVAYWIDLAGVTYSATGAQHCVNGAEWDVVTVDDATAETIRASLFKLVDADGDLPFFVTDLEPNHATP